VYRALVLPAFILLALFLAAQQQTNSTSANGQKSSPYSAIPVEAARQPNAVKATPESIVRGKKWWTVDCLMCHGENGDGKGETASEMKLSIADFTDPDTLKDRTDGQLFYVIKNGHQDMPPEGDRIKTNDGWDLVNYVRSLAKKKPDTAEKSKQ
jgi:mono/diheme cytochrome c family protein